MLGNVVERPHFTVPPPPLSNVGCVEKRREGITLHRGGGGGGDGGREKASFLLVSVPSFLARVVYL